MRVLLLVTFLLPASSAFEEIPPGPCAAATVPTRRPATESESLAEYEINLLLRSSREADALPDLDTARLVADQLEAGVRGMLVMLESQRVPEVDQLGAQRLSRPQEAILIQALSRLGRETVLPLASEYFGTDLAVAGRRARLCVVAAVGTEQDLDWAVELARQLGVEKRDDAELAAGFQRAFESIARRDASAFDWARKHWPRLTPAHTERLILAAGATRDPRGLPFLHSLALWSADLRRAAVCQIRQLAPSFDQGLDEQVAENLRTFTSSSDVRLAQSSVLALAALDDVGCIQGILPLLRHPSPGMQSDAVWALQRLTRFRFGSDVGQWEGWLERESLWLAQQGWRVLEDLESSDPALIVQGLKVGSEHVLMRRELVAHALEMLDFEHDGVRVSAVRALASAGTRREARQLIRLLEAQAPEVATAAWRGLVQLTGEDLPLDPARWTELLGSDP